MAGCSNSNPLFLSTPLPHSPHTNKGFNDLARHNKYHIFKQRMPELGRLLPLSSPTLLPFAPLSSFLLSGLWYGRTSPRVGWMGGAGSAPLQASLDAQMGLQQPAPSPSGPLVVACLQQPNFCLCFLCLGHLLGTSAISFSLKSKGKLDLGRGS